MLFWVGFFRIQWYDEGIYLYDPTLPTPRDVFVYTLKQEWLHFIVYLFIFLVWGLITWPRLRQMVAPALELAFDVGAHFSPVLNSVRPGAVADVLHGRGTSANPRLLEQQLSARLRTVIRYASDQKPGAPVAVVGHSLGAVIAMTAVKEPLVGTDGKQVAIDLVTMGCPLRMLRERFPYRYNDTLWSHWTLPGVRRWLNLYRAGDPIGRELGIPGVEDVNLCNGGHSGYFEDHDIAVFLVNWLYPGLAAASPAPANEASRSGAGSS